MSLNLVTLAGNLTRDPELKALPSGMSVLELGLAVNDRVKTANGEWADRPNFFDVVIFGRRGEALSTILAKGQKVALTGRLRWSSWETPEGKRSRVQIVADEIELMQRPASSAPGSDVEPAYEQAKADSYDDMPF